MRIVSRKVITSHSKEEVFHIMRQSSSPYRAAEFTDNSFHITFPIRWGRRMGSIPVKGIVKNQHGFTEVTIEIHGGIELYIGIVSLFAGVLVLISSFFIGIFCMQFSLFCIAVCVLIYIPELLNGIMCLDSLEHRLTRKT